MAKNQTLDSQAILRTEDEEDLKPTQDMGAEDHDKTDYLNVKGNGSDRKIVLEAQNDDEDDVDLELAAKGDGNLFANLPTSDPGVAGALWNDSNTVKVSTGS